MSPLQCCPSLEGYPDDIRQEIGGAFQLLSELSKEREENELKCQQDAEDIQKTIGIIQQTGIEIKEKRVEHETLFEFIKKNVQESLEVKQLIKQHKSEIASFNALLEEQNKKLASRKSKATVLRQAIASEQEKIEKLQDRNNQDGITIAAWANTASQQAVLIKEQTLRIQKLTEDLKVIRQKRQVLERVIDEKTTKVQELQALILTFEEHMKSLLNLVKGNEVWESKVKKYFNPEDPESSLFRRWCYGSTST